MKKFIVTSLTAILVAVIPTTSFADQVTIPQIIEPDENTYVEMDVSQVITEELEAELATDQQKIYIGDERSSSGNNVIAIDEPNEVVAVPEGTTSIATYAYGGSGVIAQDSESGYYSYIYNIGMYAAGKFCDTVGGLIFKVVDYANKTLDKSRPITAKTYKSYRYIGKEVNVYDGGGRWEKNYEAISRENYKHYFGTYVDTKGYTYSTTIDYTRPNGYNPIVTNYSPNYNNNTELKKRASNNWVKDYEYYSWPEYY